MPKKSFRIAFIPTSNSGVVYWRIWNFAETMRKITGIEVAVYCWQSEMNRAHPWQEDCYNNPRIKVEISDLARCADITIFQTICSPKGLEIFKYIKETIKKPIFTEIDDNVINIPNYNEGSKVYFANSYLEQIALDQIKLSDGVIVTTPYLKTIYSEFNKNIHVITNSIDFNLWKKKEYEHNPEQELRIGWIGGGTHSEDIEMVWPAVEQVIDSHKKQGRTIKFYCVHGVPNFLKDEKYKDKVVLTNDWEYILDYPKFMASFEFDIGIAPLLENPFNMSKSNLRWLEYSALGIPAVCSNLGHFEATIDNGRTGFLAYTESEWINRLTELIENPDKRYEMGEMAREEVKNNFNVEHIAERYVSILKKAVKDYDISGIKTENCPVS